ncbi:uncharacterized protein LOC144442295 [Glandiceps talaboti]
MVYWVYVLVFVRVVFGIEPPYRSRWQRKATVLTVNDLAVRLEDMATKYNLLENSFQDMTTKYNLLENSFQDVLKSNTDLQATVVYQASRFQQLQKTVEIIPTMLQDRHETKARVQSLETTVAELATNKQVTCAEKCRDTLTRSGNLISEDWFDKIDPKDIEILRSRFKTDDFSKKRTFGGGVDDDDYYDDDDEYDDDVNEKAIQTMSKALARLVKAEEENPEFLNDRDVGKLRIQTDSEGIGRADEHNIYDKLTKTKLTGGTGTQHINENNIEDQMEHMLRTATKSSKKMVFSVGLTKPILGHPKDPQTVVFDEIKVQRGKGYNTKKGVFKCRIAGVYYFSFTLRSYDEKHIGAALMLNDDAVVTMTTDAAKRQVMQSQSVVIKLVKNDEVWVMLGPSQDYAIYGRSDHTYNVFNGVLLFTEK